MLDVSQVSSLLQSLGVNPSVASKAVERTASKAGTDAQAFLKELQKSLQELSPASADKTTAAQTANAATTPTAASDTAADQQSTTTAKAPFGSFEEFKAWEKGLGSTFASDYQPPDYIRMISLALTGGDADAFKRYVFFKNNPQYAVDYESIRSGNLSKFPTDSSTLVKSDLSAMDETTAAYYKKNPSQLLAAEGFNMDPTLLKKRMEGDTQGMGDPDWLTSHRWTANGVVESNNRVLYAQADYIGLDGKGAGTYRLAKYDTATGNILDLDGRLYDPITGEAQA